MFQKFWLCILLISLAPPVLAQLTFQTWLEDVKKRVDTFLSPPRPYFREFGSPQNESETILALYIEPSGKLAAVYIQKPSTVAGMDQATLAAVRQAAPFAPLPPGITNVEIMIKLNILIDSAKYIDPNDTRDEQLNRQTEKLALAEKQCTQDVEKSAREALITYATQPDDASALNLLTSQVKAGQWEQILSTGSLLEGLYPNRRIRLYRSQALFMTGKLDEALKLLTQRAPWQSPDEQAIYAADYLDLEGKIRYELGQVPEAIARWEQALAQARPPEKPRLQFLLKLVKGEPNWQVDEAKHNSLYRRCANRKPLGQTLSGKLAQKYQQAKLKQPQTVTPIH